MILKSRFLSPLRAVFSILAANFIIICAVLGGMAALAGLSSSGTGSLIDSRPTPDVVRPDEARAIPISTLRANEAILRSISESGERSSRPNLNDRPLLDVADDFHTFWVINRESGIRFSVYAQRFFKDPRLILWVEEGLSGDRQGLEDLVQAFEEKIEPAARRFFPDSPAENSAPLQVLYTRSLGSTTAGYFSPPAADAGAPRRLILLNADKVRLSDDYIYGVLAHEYAHALLWETDPTEETWVSEGIAELNAVSAGYNVGSFREEFLKSPGTSLNTWDGDNATPHYGASLLFSAYLQQRFGDRAVQSLAANAGRGLAGFDAVLKEEKILSGRNEEPFRAEDLFQDWSAANLLNDLSLNTGRYGYSAFPDLPRPIPVENVTYCAQDLITRNVNQFGTDYIRLNCPGSHTLSFEGSYQSGAFPVPAHSGNSMYWCGRDTPQATLTRHFDSMPGDAPPLLTYWTWFDLARRASYVFLLTSGDGQRWQAVSTPSGLAVDSQYAWGYTGKSSRSPQWIQERIDLSAYQGRSFYLRFACRIAADDLGAGFLLDDVSLPQVALSADFENGDGGWQANGFKLLPDTLPQPFRLTLVSPGEPAPVSRLELDAGNTLDVPFQVKSSSAPAYLIVSALSRFTRQPSAYRLRFH